MRNQGLYGVGMNAGTALLTWYRENARPLPWRDDQDPYRIWISEVMLQQTTVAAVIPYYERFLKRFPSIQSLAKSSIEDVYQQWSGLGYYSRARNLHKAAIAIAENGFPQDHKTLIQLPGFGPYTSRAVASLAFDENVGVLDGNVIRFLCRFLDLDVDWWQVRERNKLQDAVDTFVKGHPAADINQALIEIGATLCTPTNPSCLLCPLQKQCQSHHNGTVEQRPRKRPRKRAVLLLWTPHIFLKNGRIKVVTNEYAPFLKNSLLFPGAIRELKTPPKDFDFQHSITKYKIYVKVSPRRGSGPEGKWLYPKQVQQKSPFSIVTKILSSSSRQSGSSNARR